jgi:hypothetical protein
MTEKCLSFEVLNTGDLKIILLPEGKSFLKEMLNDNKHYDEIWAELMKYEDWNGGYTLLKPEYIGALTNAPIIAEPCKVQPQCCGQAPVIPDDTCIWWFPEYETVNELHELRKNRSVIFTKAQPVKP